MAYSCGLLAFMLIKVLAPGYFARQDMKTPVRIAIQAMSANMLLNLILIYPFGHVGLAAATSMSAFLNAGLLLYGLLKIGVFKWQPGWWLVMFRLLAACLIVDAVRLLAKRADVAVVFLGSLAAGCQYGVDSVCGCRCLCCDLGCFRFCESVILRRFSRRKYFLARLVDCGCAAP